MSQEYCRAVLRCSMAQICQHLGWTSIQSTPLELLTDVLERYLLQLGKVTHRYSEQFGRNTPQLQDVFMAFGHMGVEWDEIADYLNHVEPLPFAQEIVSFPIPRENDLKFPNPDSKEVQQRKVFEFVPEHLPYMHPELNEESEDICQSAQQASPDTIQLEPPLVIESSPVAGDKRSLCSPGDSLVPFKRSRLMTSYPLPEEASQLHYEMTSVVMTHSGILSPLREGKLPDTKNPPAGFKQIVIVRQKSTSTLNAVATPALKLPAGTPIIKLDFKDGTNKSSNIVEVEDNEQDTGALVDIDKNDPEYRPKQKKRPKDWKGKDKCPNQNTFKIKRGPGRPKSPGRAAVVHNRGTAGFTKIPAITHTDTEPPLFSEDPIDFSIKPTPPAPNINVVKVMDKCKKLHEFMPKTTDYRPKVVSLSKQQVKDMEDTIDSVIGKNVGDVDQKEFPDAGCRPSEELRRELMKPVEKPKKPATEWRVSQITESYSGPDDNDDESDSKVDTFYLHPGTDQPGLDHSPGTYTAPHLAFLHISPKQRGRPRGSVTGTYRSPLGRKPGRPPLYRSPGRPPLSRYPGRSYSRSPGRPPLNRSPGYPSINRSPGRPPLSRSPGRPPGTGLSPGRSKGTGMSPKPRGRPRGSKSPRNRGSPRGGSPRAIANLIVGENFEAKPLFTGPKPEDADGPLFDFPPRSHIHDALSQDLIKSNILHGSEDKSSSVSSPAPTEPAGSRESSTDIPDSHSPESVKRSPSPPEEVTSPPADSVHNCFSVEVLDKDLLYKTLNGSPSFKQEIQINSRESSREKSKDMSDSENVEHRMELNKERNHKEYSKERDRGRSKEHRKDKRKKKKKNKDKEREREDDRERKEKHKSSQKEESPSLQPLQKLKIKFGGGSSSSPSGFSVTSSQILPSPKYHETSSTSNRPEIPKLKFKVLPPKPDTPSDQDKTEQKCVSWVSSIKTTSEMLSAPKQEPLISSQKLSLPYTNMSPLVKDEDLDESEYKDNSSYIDGGGGSIKIGDEEVTVSVVKGKVIVKKPGKREKRKGSGKKTKLKSNSSPFIETLGDFSDSFPKPLSVAKRELEKVESPLSPAFYSQNVSSPVTIPALKAAPPPPSPPVLSKKSPPKPKPNIKESSRPCSPLLSKELLKPIPSIPISKPGKFPKSLCKHSPKKSPKVFSSGRKKSSLSPSKPFINVDSQPPKTPSPRHSLSPSHSAQSPMYSPASSPARDSPLRFQLPATPAFPSNSHSPSYSPPSRHQSTDDEKESTPPMDSRKMLPPVLPPMPPTAAQRKAQRTVITETVGSFFNESGEKVWICPACTMQDDGSPMIGCDKCDDWYHWSCVGIEAEPDENEEWFCTKCVRPNKSTKGAKRGRKKRKI